MANLPVPIRGYAAGSPDHLPLDLTSQHINNIRVRDTLRSMLRLCQRPALVKAFAQQVGGTPSAPATFLLTVTVVD